MGLIKQNSSQYYTGEENYTPDGTEANALTWPSVMTPLIWDAGSTPTSYNNYKVFIDGIEQYPTLAPYLITQSLSTTMVDGVQTQILTLTSQQYVTGISAPSGGATGFVIGDNYTVTNAGSQIGVGINLILKATSTTGDMEIFSEGTGYINGDTIEISGQGVTGNAAYTITTSITNVPTQSIITVRLNKPSLWDNYKSYQYVNLKDVVNNFMVAYVGVDKLIPRCKRSDIVFHAKRGLQEFSYDTLRSVKSQELTIPPSLALVLPQDYVNYVQLSWIDALGVKHVIYPTTLTSNPEQVPLQDSAGIPIQDVYGNSAQAQQSLTNQRWKSANQRDLNGQINANDFTNEGVYDWAWWKMAYGQRYGLNPETSQKNGWFTIDERRGVFAFSSDLANQLIILEYISDGLAYDEDTHIPKLAEDALYMHIMYSIISTRSNFPEYVVQRYKRERSAKLRNAKIRLSNVKLEEFTQVMRGKSKWIKS
tara:strand:+ start:1894 stop:3333 length:1440 start_codon:yes stop_codon:yes gene_type:complete